MSRLIQLLVQVKAEIEAMLPELHREAASALDQHQYARLESLASELRIADEILGFLKRCGSAAPSPEEPAPAQAKPAESLAAEPSARTDEAATTKLHAEATPEAPTQEPLPEERKTPEEPASEAPTAVAQQPAPAAETQKPEEPATVVQPAPASAKQEPAEPPKPKHLICPQGKDLEALRQQFFKDAAALLDAETIDKTNRCLLKSTICLGWFLSGVEKDKPTKDTICEEVRRLTDLWKQKAGDFFFGIDRRAVSHPEYWHAFYRSLRFMHFARKAIQLLSSEKVKGSRELYETIAYCETSLFRLIGDLGLNYFDKDQLEIHHWLENSPFTPYPCWRAHAEGGPKTETVFEHAAELEPVVTDIETRLANRASREELLHALESLLHEPKSFDSFGDDLRRLVADCLSGGIPPSNTDLRRLLVPYRAELESLQHNHAAKLLEYLDKDANKALAKKLMPVEIDIPEDPEHEHRLTELKKLLNGKTLLIVGGNKGQAQKVEHMKKKLGLKDLEWPPTEEHTRNGALEDCVARADAVCIAVRWARHSRKDLLDIAKAHGKLTAVLPRGTGFNKVVYDLYGQWCNGKNGHAEAG